jgi:hypothetical protein
MTSPDTHFAVEGFHAELFTVLGMGVESIPEDDRELP